MNQKKFILLCCFVYFTSVITRSSLSVVLIEVISCLQIEESIASIAITGSFISSNFAFSILYHFHPLDNSTTDSFYHSSNHCEEINNIVNNEIILSVAVFCIAFISSVALMIFTENFVISLITITLISACMHGINLLLVGNLPIVFAKYGKVSTLSGMLNACTYIGSSISAYGIAKVTELFGWNTTITIWCCLCFMGILLCSSKVKNYRNW